MDDEIERLLVSVRADTGGFAADVAQMKGQLEGTLGTAAARAGSAIESALVSATRSGSLGFDDLGKVALTVLDGIAASALKTGIGSLTGGGGGSSSGGLAGLATSLIGGLLGLPGRATGGPVSPGAAYRVGERGPELFVPTSAGRIETGAARGGSDVRVSINVATPAGSAPEALAKSSRQVARAVRTALQRAER